MLDKIPSRRDQLLLFARNFVKHPRMLGSVIPSSRFLIEEVLDPIDWSRADVIVEYGPGVGTFTVELLRRMKPDAHLVVLETNRDFVRFLETSFRDPRLHVVNESAAYTQRVLRDLNLDGADYVISGIPFSTMPDSLRDSILRTTRAVLRPGGAFLVYQFSARVLPDLQRVFGEVERGFEPLNILPAQLFFCPARAA